MEAIGVRLSNGDLALVDEADVPSVAAYHWHRTTNYAESYVAGMMHRFLLKAPDGIYVDHINGDGLDNRRSNLRFATHQQNQWNRGKTCCDIATSRFKGVRFHWQCRCWQARIRFNGRRFSLGYFKDEEDAARAYDEAARQLHGEYARTNFEGT